MSAAARWRAAAGTARCLLRVDVCVVLVSPAQIVSASRTGVSYTQCADAFVRTVWGRSRSHATYSGYVAMRDACCRSAKEADTDARVARANLQLPQGVSRRTRVRAVAP